MARFYGGLARAGKSKNCTPKVPPTVKKKEKRGRAKKRSDYNKRFRADNTLIKRLLRNPMSSVSERGHAPVDRLNVHEDHVNYVPPPIRETYKREFDPDPSKYNRGIHTMDRDRERRLFQKDLMEYQLTGKTSLMSEWGNPHPIVKKPSDDGAWSTMRNLKRLTHLPFGTFKIKLKNPFISLPKKGYQWRQPKSIFYGPANISWKNGVQVFE